MIKACQGRGGLGAGRGGQRGEDGGLDFDLGEQLVHLGVLLAGERGGLWCLCRGCGWRGCRGGFGLRFGFGFGEAFFLGLEGAALNLERMAVEAEQEVELVLDVGRRGAVQGDFGQQDGEAGGDGVGEAVGEVAVGEAGELGGVGGEFAGGFKEVLGGKPVEKAAVVPFGEVLRADGDAVEMFGEDGLDFGEGVEPLDEVNAGFAVVEALVELVAERAGETGDFAGAFHKISEDGGLRIEDGMIGGAVLVE